MSDLCEHETFKDVCGICHRDGVITRLRAENERLRIESIQMRFALGYPMPADLEHHILPSNPFKCGTCDARAALEEAPQGRISEAAAQPAPSGWRPIETAPKDGRWILVSAPNMEPETACWSTSVWLTGWYSGGGRSDSYGPGFEPTHWMPLPPAPGKEEA